jgi:hypothetical protein
MSKINTESLLEVLGAMNSESTDVCSASNLAFVTYSFLVALCQMDRETGSVERLISVDFNTQNMTVLDQREIGMYTQTHIK